MIRMQSAVAAVALLTAGCMGAAHAIPITGVTGTVNTELEARVSDNPNPPIQDFGSIPGIAAAQSPGLS